MGPFVFLVLVLILKSESVEIDDSTTCDCQELEQKMDRLQIAQTAIVKAFYKENPAKSCFQYLEWGALTSGVYTIRPETNYINSEDFEVYCDMETDGGGWTVFQRREDGSVDFYLDYFNYYKGFGNLKGEFWLGNRNLHFLTAQDNCQLRVELSDFTGESRIAVYNTFKVDDPNEYYRLTVAGYSGNAGTQINVDLGDSLSWHTNQRFTTKDADYDSYSPRNCAVAFQGAWWYRSCHRSNLNGLYLYGETTESGKGIVWNSWKGNDYSLKTSEMKIRPHS